MTVLPLALAGALAPSIAWAGEPNSAHLERGTLTLYDGSPDSYTSQTASTTTPVAPSASIASTTTIFEPTPVVAAVEEPVAIPDTQQPNLEPTPAPVANVAPTTDIASSSGVETSSAAPTASPTEEASADASRLPADDASALLSPGVLTPVSGTDVTNVASTPTSSTDTPSQSAHTASGTAPPTSNGRATAPATTAPSDVLASVTSDDSSQNIVLSASEGPVVVVDEGLPRHEQAAVLAQIATNMTRSAFDALITSAGGLDASEVTDTDIAYGQVRLGITNGMTVLQTIERLKALPGFLDVQPNYVYSKLDEDGYTDVNDPYSFRQWGLYSVRAYAAWDYVKTVGSVAVAVIDTGADLDHPDLEANIIAKYNAVSSSNTIEDQVGHGTHVAGIIAGIANNEVGIAGVSYNANLVIIKASTFKSSDFDTASIVRAYAWLESYDDSGFTVAQHYNVRIVNMSIGGLDDTLKSNMPDEALNRAMTIARDEYGLLTVVAAGNGIQLELPYFAYPGDSDACISVMNLCEKRNDMGEPIGVELDESSNFNMPGSDYKDICAPGSRITSTWINGQYAIDSGTSMAAPMVSGIAALLFAVNPSLTPQAAMGILEATATDLGDEGWDEMYGYGGVNAVAAVRMASGARIRGWDVVGLGGSAWYTPSLGNGLEEDGSGWTWTVWQGEGGATVNAVTGVLTGWAEGDVTLVATTHATTGAEISATYTVHVIDPDIIGDDSVAVGAVSTPYTTSDDRWTWVWHVEDGTGSAIINQDGILTGISAGTVTVTATCASNSGIVFSLPVTITV